MRPLGDVPPEEPVDVSVLLAPRLPIDTLESVEARLDSGAHPLTREQFAGMYSAAPDAIERVRAFAAAHCLEVVSVSPARRTMVLRGRAADMGAAFGVRLQRIASEAGQEFHAPDGEPRVPAELAGDVEGVFGLDSHPVAQHHQARTA
jgi:kumamolisin